MFLDSALSLLCTVPYLPACREQEAPSQHGSLFVSSRRAVAPGQTTSSVHGWQGSSLVVLTLDPADGPEQDQAQSTREMRGRAEHREREKLDPARASYSKWERAEGGTSRAWTIVRITRVGGKGDSNA